MFCPSSYINYIALLHVCTIWNSFLALRQHHFHRAHLPVAKTNVFKRCLLHVLGMCRRELIELTHVSMNSDMFFGMIRHDLFVCSSAELTLQIALQLLCASVLLRHFATTLCRDH